MRPAAVARVRLPRPSRLTRLVALVAAVGQLLVAVAAWADSAGATGDARSHVEQAGTRLHHAHVESDCALCAAQHIGAAPAPRAVAPPHVAARSVPPVNRGVAQVASRGRGLHPPRAPPTEV